MSKLTAAEAAEIPHRSLPLVAVLTFFTLGIYSLYLCYQWAKEINGLEGRVKYHPVTVLVVSMVTLCVGAVVYECLFAFEAAQAGRQRGLDKELADLPTWVILANGLTFVASLAVIGIPVAMVLGTAATVLVQAGFNRLADNVQAVEKASW
jgi:hypothetical protein